MAQSKSTTVYEIILKDNFSKAMGKVIAATKKFDDEFKAATSNVKASQEKIKDGFDKIKHKSNQTTKKVKANNSSLTGSFNSIRNAISGAAVAFGAYQLAQFGKDVVKLQADFESYNNTLRFASGTTQEYAANQAFLKKTINDLGLDVVSATKGFGQFAANTKGTVLQGEETRKIFESVSMAATTLGTSVDDTNGIFRALGQIVSKGAVQSEELRGQLGERIASAYKIAADSMGLTTEEMADQIKAGKVLAEDFLPKFSAQLKKVFEKDSRKAAKSLRAQMNLLNNSFIEIRLSMAKYIVPLTLKLIDGFNKFYSFLKENKDVLKEVFKPLIDFGNEAINIIFSVFDGFKKTNGEATTLEELFNRIGNGLKKLKPIFDIILWGLKEIVHDIKFVINVIEAFNNISNVIKATWEGIKASFSENIRFIGTALGKFIKMVSNAWSKVVKLDFSGALNEMKEGTKALIDGQIRNGERSGEAFNQAYEKKLSELNFDFFAEQKIRKAAIISIAKEKLEQKKEQEKNTNTSPLSPKTPTGTTPSASGDSLGATTSGASTSKSTNINIDVSKIVETLNVNSTNLTESTAVIEEKITMALLKVLNNANNLANG